MAFESFFGFDFLITNIKIVGFGSLVWRSRNTPKQQSLS